MLRVVVGVIQNNQGEILISQRSPLVYQGSLWEFPGGKVGPGETVQQALVRELREELGIKVQKMSHLIKIKHNYPDVCICLDVWKIEAYYGFPKACEGQPLQWVLLDELTNYVFPEANRPILSAIQLPEYYAILAGDDLCRLQYHLEQILDKGVKLLQLRIKSLSAAAVEQLLLFAVPRCKKIGAVLLLNSAVANASHYADLDGIHLTSNDLMNSNSRPSGYCWVAASCHNTNELVQAQKIGVDFAVLAPVMPTPTHPEAGHLGWANFAALVAGVNIPVYALGGMSRSDVKRARAAGGQGVAGISMFIAGE